MNILYISEVGGLVQSGNEVSVCLSIAWSSSLASNIDRQSWGFRGSVGTSINSLGVSKFAKEFQITVMGFKENVRKSINSLGVSKSAKEFQVPVTGF